MKSSKGKCTWDERIPCNIAGWEAALLKRCWVPLGDSKLKQNQPCVLAAINATSILWYTNNSVASQLSAATIALYSVLTRPYLDNCIQLLGPPIQERWQQAGAKFGKGPVR